MCYNNNVERQNKIREVKQMKEYIQQQSEKATNLYLTKRTQFDELIKSAVTKSAKRGLNTACLSFQGDWAEMKLAERYLKDLRCYNISGGSNYSWKHIHFSF